MRDVEILDAQVHLNHIHPSWQTAEVEDILAAALAAMDAVGIDGLVVSEFWGFNGRWREQLCPTARFGRGTRSRSWPRRASQRGSCTTR